MSDVTLNATTVRAASYIENEKAKTFIEPTTKCNNQQEKRPTKIKQTGTGTNGNIESSQLTVKKQESVRTTRSTTAKEATSESIESQNIPNSTEQTETQNNNPNETYLSKQGNILLNSTVIVKEPKVIKFAAVISTPTSLETNKTRKINKIPKATTKFNMILRKPLLPSPALNKRSNKELMRSVTAVKNKCTPTQHSMPSPCLSTNSHNALKVSEAAFQKLQKNQEKEQNALKKHQEKMLALNVEWKKDREEFQRGNFEKENLKLLETQIPKEQQLQKNGKIKMKIQKRTDESGNQKRNQKAKNVDLSVYVRSEAPLLPTDL